MTAELDILQGVIAGVVFQNYDNGYSVLRLRVSNQETVTVVGTIPLPVVGERLMVTGKWSSHPSYGRQFEAEFLERLMPQSAPEILTYLSGRAVKGIGPKTAARIVDKFGESTLAVMEREPHRLAEVPGISKAKAEAIGQAFRLQVGIRSLMEFFSVHHLTAELAVRTYKLYGEDSMQLLYDNPYMLMEESLEAPFEAVDRFAIEMGVSGADPRRVEAGILFELGYNRDAGHSFLPRQKLIPATAKLLSLSEDEVEQALERLVQELRVMEHTLANISVCYLPELFEAETFSTDALLHFARSRYPAPQGLERKLKQAAKEADVEYSQQQADAIREAACSGLLIVTGGPGTGKTTIIKGILSLYEQMGLQCTLAAPTGRAAKRMSEVTGMEASTIHRLLGAGIDPVTGKLFFARDEGNPLKTHAVIVDEVSMVDILLLSSLLRAIPQNARVILVGDPDQLPPVGPGFPFSDMLRSGILPTVRLTQIFRQAQESLIVMNAHKVNQGQYPELRNVKKDFFFLSVRSEEAVAQTVAGLCETRLPQNMGIPSEQIQVLSPTKKTGAGTFQLNRLLQSRLNPPIVGKAEKKFGELTFREGDRVMQIRNNYDILWKKADGASVGTGIFNGDIGTVLSIDQDMETVSIQFDDRIADYDFTMLSELEPAYAITVHKSQGSEYRAVVLVCFGGSPYLLNRSVLYTAITRAKELLVIVGTEEAVAKMVENARVGRRYSGLKLRLQGEGL